MTFPHASRVGISHDLRARLTEEFPQVFDRAPDARLFQELLFAQWRDGETGDPVIGQSLLARLEGREAELTGKRYSGRAFLEGFTDRTALQLDVREADYRAGRARTVRLAESAALKLMRSFELLHTGERELVDFVTGRPITSRQLERQRTVRRAIRRAYDPGDTPTAPGIRILNRMPPHVFTKVAARLDEAVSVAETMRPPSRQQANLSTLYLLRQVGCDPWYQAVSRTPRIYTSGWSAAQLSSPVRATLFGTSLHFDLAAAQLAIIAQLWSLPQIDGALRETVVRGHSPWPLLLHESGLTSGDKDAFKRLIYSAAYGMHRAGLQGQARRAFGEERAHQLFRTPMMQELLAGRDARQSRLRREGGIVDAFGQSVRLEEREGRSQRASETSLLAHEAQSYELKIMWPALEMANRVDEFRILLWLHDGFYATSTDHSRTERYQHRVMKEVDEQAQRLGFATRLIAEPLV